MNTVLNALKTVGAVLAWPVTSTMHYIDANPTGRQLLDTNERYEISENTVGDTTHLALCLKGTDGQIAVTRDAEGNPMDPAADPRRGVYTGSPEQITAFLHGATVGDRMRGALLSGLTRSEYRSDSKELRAVAKAAQAVQKAREAEQSAPVLAPAQATN